VRNKVLPAGSAVPQPPARASASGYSNFKLHSYWRSTSSWRVRIALALKGIQYETVPANLATLVGNTTASLPELAELNSMEQVPVLTFDGPDGTHHSLTQSIAIIDFLDSISPAGPLLPKDPLARARCLQIAELVNSCIQPGIYHTPTVSLTVSLTHSQPYISLFTIHHSLFTIHSLTHSLTHNPIFHYSLFTIHYSLTHSLTTLYFTSHYSLVTIHYSLFTIHYSLFTHSLTHNPIFH
jgi:hypothetical protein